MDLYVQVVSVLESSFVCHPNVLSAMQARLQKLLHSVQSHLPLKTPNHIGMDVLSKHQAVQAIVGLRCHVGDFVLLGLKFLQEL